MIIQFPKPKRYRVYVNEVCVGVYMLKRDAELMARHMKKYGLEALVKEAA